MEKFGKDEAKVIISQLLAKALIAVVKIIRVKILPKLMERYCKNLQKGAEKLANKTHELIEKLNKITDEKKKIGTLYVLKLVKETVFTVGTALSTLAKYIEDTVDFSPIEEPKSPEAIETIAMLETAANGGNDIDLMNGGCGSDGCEIA